MTSRRPPPREPPSTSRGRTAREPKVEITLFGKRMLVTHEEAMRWRICDGALKGEYASMRNYFEMRHEDELARAAEPKPPREFIFESHGPIDQCLGDALVKLGLADWTHNYRGRDMSHGAKENLNITKFGFEVAFELTELKPSEELIKELEQNAVYPGDVHACLQAEKVRRSKCRDSNVAKACEAENKNFVVGYGKPPIGRQFEKGRSGNAGTRKKQQFATPLIGDYAVPAAHAPGRGRKTVDDLILAKLQSQALKDPRFVRLWRKVKASRDSLSQSRSNEPARFVLNVGFDPCVELASIAILERVPSLGSSRTRLETIPKLRSQVLEAVLSERPQLRFIASELKVLSLSLRDPGVLAGWFQPVDLAAWQIPRMQPTEDHSDFQPFDPSKDRSPIVPRLQPQGDRRP